MRRLLQAVLTKSQEHMTPGSMYVMAIAVVAAVWLRLVLQEVGDCT